MKNIAKKPMASDDDLTRLKNLVELKDKEINYLRKIASDIGNIRLRETEELSKSNAMLKEKMAIVSEQRIELEALYQKIERVSVTDELTGLLNRRGLMMQVDQAFYTFKRQVTYEDFDRQPKIGFTCAMIDIDHFKLVNDNFGHLAGDKVLVELGRIINRSGVFREADIIGRYGGEEFMIVLPGCTPEGALKPINRLLEKIRSFKFVVDADNTINVTISVGLSQVNPSDFGFDSAFERADKALYNAKALGRDRIEISQET